jgi:REP element-mobilizing transposase RayT/DNA-binding CsgD family transcriptional regulator
MPRAARVLSETGIYHILLSGNGRQDIFLDEEDKNKIIGILVDKKREREYALYAYCVMDNHVHIIIKDIKAGNIGAIMKRIGTTYAQYFNQKYKRVGHVFQDRYRSEPIEDKRYLLAVVRYIHKNPEKACIGKQEEYLWSSYKEYTGQVTKLLESREVLGVLSEDMNTAIQEFIIFSEEDDLEVYLDVKGGDPCKISEEAVMEYILSYLEKERMSLAELSKPEFTTTRNQLVCELIQFSHLSKRKIAELIGINRETVRKIVMSIEPSL